MQTTPADHGPRPRSRSIRADYSRRSAGRAAARARGSGRAGREPRRAARATRAGAARTAPLRANVAAVGGSQQPSSSDGESARITRRSSFLAVFESMSCPQTARSSACATVAVRTGRSPRKCFGRARRAAGRRAKRRRNSEWSSSSASAQRSLLGSLRRLGPDRHDCRRGDCQARATASATAGREEPVPHRRVASPASRADSSSEYGPLGRTAISTMSASLLPRLDTAGRASCGGLRSALPFDAVARPVTAPDLVIGLVLVAAVVVLFAHGHGRRANAILADPRRTPGVLNPDVTQANIRSTICRTAGRRRSARRSRTRTRSRRSRCGSTARRARCPTTRRIT